MSFVGSGLRALWAHGVYGQTPSRFTFLFSIFWTQIRHASPLLGYVVDRVIVSSTTPPLTQNKFTQQSSSKMSTMLAKTIARRTVSLSSSSVTAARPIHRSTVSRFSAGAHGHDDHHAPHPVRFKKMESMFTFSQWFLMTSNHWHSLMKYLHTDVVQSSLQQKNNGGDPRFRFLRRRWNSVLCCCPPGNSCLSMTLKIPWSNFIRFFFLISEY